MKMCQAFAANGHQVTLLVRTRSRRKGDNIFRYYGVKPDFKVKTFFESASRLGKLWSRGLGVLSSIINPRVAERAISKSVYGLKCWRFLSDLGNPPDLVYGRFSHGIYAATLKGFCSVYEVHEPLSTESTKKLERRILKSPYFKRLVVISEALKNEYLKQFPFLEEDKVLVAPSGADIPDSKSRKSPEIVNWPGRQNSLQVGYVGALYRGKGMELISKLVPLLEDADFHIVGGDDRDINYWKKKIRQKNAHFYGFVAPGSLGAYYRKFDIVLAPFQKKIFIAPRNVTARWNIDISRWTSPLKIFEYMAYGKPIVASNLPVVKEILKNEENALLCDPEDVESWKAAVLKLKESASLRRKLGTRAFKDLQNKYTWSRRAEKVIHGINCEKA
jgi:glycosyltransferase involved in cell wall biosynthesis